MDTFRHRRFARDPALVAERVIDETILVALGPGATRFAGPYVLNEVGGHIWSLLDGVRTGEEIAAAVAAEFEVSVEEAERDVAAFLDQLERLGAVRTV
ncbi:MAG: PqqD family peptide modification chaperone [Anaerolineae bacterium]|nr:PqqD family peptide modification chaperone [Anaerolineae bacterium]